MNPYPNYTLCYQTPQHAEAAGIGNGETCVMVHKPTYNQMQMASVAVYNESSTRSMIVKNRWGWQDRRHKIKWSPR